MDTLGTFYQGNAFWILPMLIFTARVVDVSIGTLRIIFLSRGLRYLAPLCGFFEVLVWLLAISQIMQNLDSWMNYLCYAAGFAMGNYIGMAIEHKLAMGVIALRVISNKDPAELVTRLKGAHFGVTILEGRGAEGKVHLIFMVVKRKNLPYVARILKECMPSAFVTVDDVRSASGGVFPLSKAHLAAGGHRALREKKGK